MLSVLTEKQMEGSGEERGEGLILSTLTVTVEDSRPELSTRIGTFLPALALTLQFCHASLRQLYVIGREKYAQTGGANREIV